VSIKYLAQLKYYDIYYDSKKKKKMVFGHGNPSKSLEALMSF
jgi:hypothetical protein